MASFVALPTGLRSPDFHYKIASLTTNEQPRRKAEPPAMTTESNTRPPPDGFIRSLHRGPFSLHNGPVFHKIDGERFWHGLYITERHSNSRGRLHGGMMTAFADGLLATAVGRVNSVPAVTVNLNCNICAAADIGDWLEGTARQTSAADGFAFVEAEAWVGEKIIFNATGVFRFLEKP